jgi:hypothetical protein
MAYALLTAGVVFWPAFIIAMAVLRAPARAFVLAGTFTMGAFLGTFFSLMAAEPLLGRHVGDARTWYTFAFCSLGAVAGGVLAVYLLGRLAGESLWRRP